MVRSIGSNRTNDCLSGRAGRLRSATLGPLGWQSNPPAEARFRGYESGTICDHSRPKRFKYFLSLSASLVLAFRPRETLNNLRPASERERESRQTLITLASCT